MIEISFNKKKYSNCSKAFSKDNLVEFTISFNKKKYSICRKAFSKDNLVEFINGLLLGKDPLMNLPEFKEFKKVDKWDGKDYIPPKTEKSDDL